MASARRGAAPLELPTPARRQRKTGRSSETRSHSHGGVLLQDSLHSERPFLYQQRSIGSASLAATRFMNA
jgi:hypothetical protein